MASEQSQAFYQQFLTALKSKYNPDLIKGIHIFFLSYHKVNIFIAVFMQTTTCRAEYTVIEHIRE